MPNSTDEGRPAPSLSERLAREEGEKIRFEFYVGAVAMPRPRLMRTKRGTLLCGKMPMVSVPKIKRARPIMQIGEMTINGITTSLD